MMRDQIDLGRGTKLGRQSIFKVLGIFNFLSNCISGI